MPSSKLSQRNLTSVQPLTAPRTLTDELIARLTADILGGKLSPGSQLPTEQEMIAATGVSRTVVREAVAALRAEGLVTTRQGAGAFVSADATSRPFRLVPRGLSSIAEVLNVMELRVSVETEAAGLAAARGTPAARRRVGRCLAAIDRAIARDESAVDEDFAFHLAIADASMNPQFAHFLDYLGRFIIPRQSVRVSAHQGEARRAYLARIQREHAAIFAAIEVANPEGAREAMRRHLVNSQERYRQLSAQRDTAPAMR